MAGVFRIGVIGVINRSTSKPFMSATVPALIQSCGIKGRVMRAHENIVRPKPFPYKERVYGVFNALLDRTLKRFDDNTKLIVVEGPIATGKSAFAKELAHELDMMYMPQPSMDEVYINDYGYDMRQLDPELPEDARSYDIKNFCSTPNGRNAANFQIRMYMLRFSKYVDALAHILSTGQGVVCNRCPYTDYVFVETMFKHGYMSKGARSVYYDLRAHTITEIMKPNLIVYLDVPVSKVKENIKKRGNDYEVQSKVFTDAYLTDMEYFYKHRYIKDITRHAELLVYDWSNGGETEVVVEDIEQIDFDCYYPRDPKQDDWRKADDWAWCEFRQRYTYEKPELMDFFNVPRFDVPELVMSADDSQKFTDIWYNAPGMKYAPGYNKDMGDTGLLTKRKMPSLIKI